MGDIQASYFVSRGCESGLTHLLRYTSSSNHQAMAYRPRRGSAPASITPESLLNLITVGAEGLPHDVCVSTLCPRDPRSLLTSFAIRSSRFSIPGLIR